MLKEFTCYQCKETYRNRDAITGKDGQIRCMRCDPGEVDVSMSNTALTDAEKALLEACKRGLPVAPHSNGIGGEHSWMKLGEHRHIHVSPILGAELLDDDE